MSNRRITKCLLELSERERTTPIIMERLNSIKKQLNRIAGVLRSCTEERIARNPAYYSQLLNGWADKLNSLGYELVIAHSELAKRLST